MTYPTCLLRARRLTTLIILSTCGFLWLLVLDTSSAATLFFVNSQEDTIDINPGDGDCEDAAGNCTLRAAIMESNAQAGRETIQLPAGIYPLTRAGVLEDLGQFGDLDILSDVIIEGKGAGPESVILDGQNLDRVIDILNPNISVTLDKLTIQNGNSQQEFGGGIRNLGLLTLSRCQVIDNTHTLENFFSHFPAGLHSEGATLEIDNCRFDNNTGINLHHEGERLSIQDSMFSRSVYGLVSRGPMSVENSSFMTNTFGLEVNAETGLYSILVQNNSEVGFLNGGFTEVHGSTFTRNGQGIANSEILKLYDSIVSENKGQKHGAGIYNGQWNVLEVVRSEIISNTVTFPPESTTPQAYGGGIRNYLGQVVIDQSLIAGNISEGHGGGLSNAARTYASRVNQITNSQIINNAATEGGGGIHQQWGNLTIEDTLIANNNANTISGVGLGGGIYIQEYGGITGPELERFEIVNSTISGNRAASGGAIMADSLALERTVYIYSSTIVSNTAELSTGGLFNKTTDFQLTNSILADNGRDCLSARPITSGGYNLLGVVLHCPFSGNGSLDMTNQRSGLGPLDRQFNPPSHPPLSGSAIVDGADPDGCKHPSGLLLQRDQRGYLRIVDGDNDDVARCDIGAHELGDWSTVSNQNDIYLPALWEGQPPDSDLIPVSQLARLIDEPAKQNKLMAAGYLSIFLILGVGAFALPFTRSKREDTTWPPQT